MACSLRTPPPLLCPPPSSWGRFFFGGEATKGNFYELFQKKTPPHQAPSVPPPSLLYWGGHGSIGSFGNVGNNNYNGIKRNKYLTLKLRVTPRIPQTWDHEDGYWPPRWLAPGSRPSAWSKPYHATRSFALAHLRRLPLPSIAWKLLAPVCSINHQFHVSRNLCTRSKIWG